MSATDTNELGRGEAQAKHDSARLQEATALHQSGHPREALLIYQEILANRPDHPDVLNLSGVAAYQLGDGEQALRWLQTAVNLKPNDPDIHYNLGLVLQSIDRFDDALASWRSAVRLKPDHVSAHNALGNVLQKLGRDEEAAIAYRSVIKSDPRHANAHNNLGIVHRRLGKFRDALAAFRTATHLAPSEIFFWQDLAACLAQCSDLGLDGQDKKDLEGCLAREGMDLAWLGSLVARVLKQQPGICQLLSSAESRPIESQSWLRGAIQTLDDPLLAAALEKSPIPDIDLESLLTDVRRAILWHAKHERLSEVIDKGKLHFLCALAQQCFLNEYVYFESEDETGQVADIIQRIDARIAKREPLEPEWIAVIAAYRPLHAVEFMPSIEHAGGHPALEKLVTQQVNEPLEERAIRDTIPPITGIADGISHAVRAQYEENPYPRWVGFRAVEPRSMASAMIATFPHLKDRRISWPDSPEILVAGCGTGKHPIMTARKFAGSRVLAVDLSLSSLAYGVRKAREMGIPNLRFAHGDLMAMGDLDYRFDIVESGGTLQCLEDPLAGWRILVDLLKDGGFMGIGLYSRFARREVVAAREFIANHGYPPTPEGIRKCRKDVMALPDGDLAKKAIRSRDFFTTSECRDHIFHVMEHQSTLPQIAEWIDELGLEFVGFQLDKDFVLPQYLNRFPEDPSATSLERWHQFERDNPDTFTTMYQFWVRKP
jgi:Flp pilus assembly protein TadD/SAM-dependent methyltransferase